MKTSKLAKDPDKKSIFSVKKMIDLRFDTLCYHGGTSLMSSHPSHTQITEYSENLRPNIRIAKILDMDSPTGDTNINLLSLEKADSKKYLGLLEQYNMHQIVSKPTRTASTSSTLIDHIIVSHKDLVKHTDMLPCPTISDHNGPHTFLNVRLKKYEPYLEYIRDERKFNEEIFLKDLEQVPFSLVYGVDDPNEKLECLTP